MAMITCPECKKKISESAENCPHCGYKLNPEEVEEIKKAQSKQKTGCIGCLGVIAIIVILSMTGVFSTDSTKSTIEKTSVAKEKQIKTEEEEKRKKEIRAFEDNIEEHYSEIVKYAENNQYDAALDKIKLFEKYGQADYKDIKKYNQTIKTEKLSMKVKSLPSSDIKENLDIYKELVSLNPDNKKFQDKVDYYQKKWDKLLKEKQDQEYKASCLLELKSSNWKYGYGYATYEGVVTNISGKKMENVQAVVSWYDDSGQFITSGSSLIEYNPILAGQSSPFKVMHTYNPAMKGARVEFSYLMGGTIKTYQKK